MRNELQLKKPQGMWLLQIETANEIVAFIDESFFPQNIFPVFFCLPMDEWFFERGRFYSKPYFPFAGSFHSAGPDVFFR